MKNLLIVSAACALALSACASSDTGRDEDKAAEALAAFDKTGETESCLSLRRIDQIKALDDKNFLVRVGRDDYYLNEVNGRCSNADGLNTRLQYRTTLSQLCRNELISVVDNGTGMNIGSCGLGTFQKLEKKSG
ncbi:DUF6491 family protein [Parvularcula sp. IMCC14364]|uniref:DUF6491 family protein n=1 Tax=Parvularcula sp. IMCC14364 TaxID=3067902 RepID=UPI0027419F39|nr:DUF6491 family protein [Parvularcula sp. IMCC14364]